MPEPIPHSDDRAALLALLREVLHQAAEYVQKLTRLVAAEWKVKVRNVQLVALCTGIALLLLPAGFLMLTFALAAVIAAGFNSWGWAFFVVGLGYAIAALLLMLPLARAFRSGLLRFPHTRDRVRQDSRWLKDRMAA